MWPEAQDLVTGAVLSSPPSLNRTQTPPLSWGRGRGPGSHRGSAFRHRPYPSSWPRTQEPEWPGSCLQDVYSRCTAFLGSCGPSCLGHTFAGFQISTAPQERGLIPSAGAPSSELEPLTQACRPWSWKPLCSFLSSHLCLYIFPQNLALTTSLKSGM